MSLVIIQQPIQSHLIKTKDTSSNLIIQEITIPSVGNQRQRPIYIFYFSHPLPDLPVSVLATQFLTAHTPEREPSISQIMSFLCGELFSVFPCHSKEKSKITNVIYDLNPLLLFPHLSWSPHCTISAILSFTHPQICQSFSSVYPLTGKRLALFHIALKCILLKEKKGASCTWLS